ncbi:UNVERIFIED_CONTAM: hypothetical protein FKN15_031374 [Acipenser sinensis]
MGLGELQKYLHLTKPRSLLAALQLIQEWEDMTQEESSACLRSTVQTRRKRYHWYLPLLGMWPARSHPVLLSRKEL